MSGLLRRLFQSPARRQYEQQGYHVFRGALPKTAVETLAQVIRREVVPYQGPLLRQDGQIVPHDFFPGTTLVRNSLANAHLPLNEAMRPLEAALAAVVASPAVATRLHELDDARHYNIHQVLLFFAAQSTELHIDSWGLDTAPRGFAHTLWIPLQDMAPGSGLPSVIPWPRGEVLSEAALGLPATGSRGERYESYQRAFTDRVMAEGPEVATAVVRQGDLIVWTSLTPHFTFPPQLFPAERLSLQVLLRPIESLWGDFIDQPSTPPTNRHIRVNDHFSYFVNERISHEFGIGGSLGAPATAY